MVASSRIKQRLLPLCAFLSAFTIVMTILVYSTDIQGRRYHRIELNLSIATDFQNAAQDNPQLIKYIRDHHLKSPPQSPRSGFGSSDFNESTALVLQPEFTKVFHLKRNGVFVETGAYRHGQKSNTYWLEKNLGWRGLLTQPDPHDYNILEQCVNKRTNSHIANVCISPTSNPKQVSFRHSTISDSQQSPKKKDILTNVECFPLYSLLLAYNATNIDFLSLNAEKAEFQVLKTLPFHKVNLRVIGVVSASSEKEEEDEEDVARVTKFLLARGFKLHDESTTRQLRLFICSRANSDCTSPRITI